LLAFCNVVTSRAQSEMHDHAMHDMEGMDHDMSGMHHDMSGMSAEEHAAHLAMLKNKDFTVTKQNYDIPNVDLVEQSGTHVDLRKLLEGNTPVAVNFIFTTCTTICPVMTATFAQMRKELGADADRILLVSITVDPEHDTPSVLAEYAGHFEASSGWQFLTGSPKDIERVLKTFDAWTGTKTNHRPITLLHKQGGTHWVRLEGLASASVLAQQARTVIQ
jgi:protein SCO1/2